MIAPNLVILASNSLVLQPLEQVLVTLLLRHGMAHSQAPKQRKRFPQHFPCRDDQHDLSREHVNESVDALDDGVFALDDVDVFGFGSLCPCPRLIVTSGHVAYSATNR